MSKKLKGWLSQLDDNSIESIATEIVQRLWLDTDFTAEQADDEQREIYNELLRIKES